MRSHVLAAAALVYALAPPLAVAQTLQEDDAFVIHAQSRQATTSAPLTLTFPEYFMQGKKRMVRRTEFTIPPSDVLNGLTAQVRGNFRDENLEGFLFVLDVRGRNIPATTSSPLVLTLASGAVVTVPSSAIHNAGTFWLRGYLKAAPNPSASGNSGNSAVGPIIAAKCAKDWPDDFRMRKYCQDQQSESVSSLEGRLMSDTPDHQTIRTKCATDWPDDFRMRNYCEVEQLKALAAIGK